MGLDYALEELYATGWSALDTRGCTADATGRLYPTVERVKREFDEAGHTLKLEHVQLFDCYKAQWTEAGGSEPAGSVVGYSADEAGVFALARFRRTLSPAHA